MGRNRLTSIAFAFVCASGVFCSAGAESPRTDGYYEGKEEGWFWRELLPAMQPPTLEPEIETRDKSEEPVQEPPIQTEAPQPRPLSPEWMRAKLPEYRDKALEQPTPDNVRAYFYLQRYAMDMAERFALVAQKVVLADPSLDENTRRPISTYGGQVFDEVARENTLRVATRIASLAGMWYFYKSDCPYCRAQNPILERLQRRIGLVVLPIALDGRAMPEAPFGRFVPNKGHAQQLGVTQTPTLYLVRKPNEFVLISEGLVTDDGLLERIVYAAHDAGWITDEEFNSTRAAKPSGLSVDPEIVDADLLGDPVKLVQFLRAHDPAEAMASPQP
jgi:conjugal transfer pilus assembly protein TraF